MTLALRLCHSSAQSACSAGLVHFTMQLKPCGRRTRTKFPTCSNSSSSENGVLLGMLAKWHQLFWTFVLTRPKQFFTPPVFKAGPWPVAPPVRPPCTAASTAGRPGAGPRARYPKTSGVPRRESQTAMVGNNHRKSHGFLQNHSVLNVLFSQSF